MRWRSKHIANKGTFRTFQLKRKAIRQETHPSACCGNRAYFEARNEKRKRHYQGATPRHETPTSALGGNLGKIQGIPPRQAVGKENALHHVGATTNASLGETKTKSRQVDKSREKKSEGENRSCSCRRTLWSRGGDGEKKKQSEARKKTDSLFQRKKAMIKEGSRVPPIRYLVISLGPIYIAWKASAAIHGN